jgi:hypothetical protein
LQRNKEDLQLFVKADSVDDIKDFNARLGESEKKVRNYFETLALSCVDAKGHVRKILDLAMSLNVQVKTNLIYGNNVPNKHYNDHISLQRDLYNLFICILSSVQKKFLKRTWPRYQNG